MNSEVRILVVDDNVDMANSLASLLRLRGYDVRTACDGIEALSTAESFAPDCVLLDLSMPRMGGAELARTLRERHGTNIVLVAVSARDDLDIASADLVSVDHWLRKPVDFGALYTIFPDVSRS